MELTKKERLFLSLQLRILEQVDTDNSEYYEKHRIAVEEGYALHYDWITEHLNDGLDEGECKFVLDVLDMYRAMHFGYKELQDKSGIDESDIRFPGFDGNNEPEYLGYVKYFVVDLNRYSELIEDVAYPDFNSHSPMIETYRNMLDKWKGLSDKYSLKRNEILALIGR